jgi:hypothetical protein
VAALLGALSIACNGDSIASPSSSTPSVPPVSGEAPSTTSLAIHLGVSSRGTAVGDTIELRVEASSSSTTGLSGLSGSISFDPARLAFAQAVPAPNVILVAHEGSPGHLAVASVAAGPGTTTSVLRFAVRGAGYADSLCYRFEEAVSKKLAPITQADVHQPAVDSVPNQGLEPRSVTMATRAVALADLAQPDSTPPPPPGGYLYGDVNADGRISVLDAAIVAALAAGDTVALAYLPIAANVDPANPPGLGGADDPLPPGRNANGTYTVDLADVGAPEGLDLEPRLVNGASGSLPAAGTDDGQETAPSCEDGDSARYRSSHRKRNHKTSALSSGQYPPSGGSTSTT